MHLAQILSTKGSAVVTTGPGTTVLDAIRTLVDHNIGAVVVVQEGHPVGILSERDILRFTAAGQTHPAAATVGQLMTRELVTATPTDSIRHAMEEMTRHRVRHLPILDDSGLVGIVSIGDLVNALRTESEEENQHLKEYIATAG
jgi:CBS domain-containing protein